MRAAAALAVLLAGCSCKKEPPPAEVWTRAHSALFDRERSVGVAPCALTKAGCLGLTPDALHRAPFESQKRLVGGDALLPFIGEDVDFLTGPRREEALRAIAAAMAVAPETDPVAAALFGADLWERFDALSDPALKEAVAKLMRHLALPEATLRGLKPNAPQISATWSALLPGWGGPEWVEVRAEYSDTAGSPLKKVTRHAERSGHRMFFRVLARVPPEEGGAGWLADHLSVDTDLPPGTILALVGAPLVLSREGTVVPLPVVAFIELRTSRALAAPTLADAPFEVLEGERQLLRQPVRPTGGLFRLGPEALLPVGATCQPDRSAYEPLKGACTMCHGTGRARLTGPFAHGALRLVVESDPNAAAAEVVRIKSASPELLALKKIWGQ